MSGLREVAPSRLSWPSYEHPLVVSRAEQKELAKASNAAAAGLIRQWVREGFAVLV